MFLAIFSLQMMLFECKLKFNPNKSSSFTQLAVESQKVHALLEPFLHHGDGKAFNQLAPFFVQLKKHSTIAQSVAANFHFPPEFPL